MTAPYVAPLHFAVVRYGKLAGNRDVAFWAEAVRLQLIDAAKVWGLAPPGMAVYDARSSDSTLPLASTTVHIGIVDDDGDDEAAGFHSLMGGEPYGLVDLHQSDEPSTVLSHEALELLGNAQLDRWVPGPGGLEYAVELGDPVQRDSYAVEVEVMGEKRDVEVSNFVFPSWFGLKNAAELDDAGQTNMLGKLDPFELAEGGYQIASDDDGRIVYLAHKRGAAMPPSKARPTSRTARLIAAGRGK
jgi:hypothetical protein